MNIMHVVVSAVDVMNNLSMQCHAQRVIFGYILISPRELNNEHASPQSVKGVPLCRIVVPRFADGLSRFSLV